MAIIAITHDIFIIDSEIELTAIRAESPGGQHVNKTSTAIHLRFDIKQSSLPDTLKFRLLQSHDYRITSDGVVVIKAQRHRSQEQNKEDAIERLVSLIEKSSTLPKKRIRTKPSKGSVRRRLENKTQRGLLKKLRQAPP